MSIGWIVSKAEGGSDWQLSLQLELLLSVLFFNKCLMLLILLIVITFLLDYYVAYIGRAFSPTTCG